MAPTNIYQNYSISLDRKLLASTHSYGSLQSNQELLTTLNTATTILLYLAEKYPCGKRKAVILTVTSHYTRYYFTVYTHTHTLTKLLIDYSFLTAQLLYYKWQYNTVDLLVGLLIKPTFNITENFLLKYSHHKLSCPVVSSYLSSSNLFHLFYYSFQMKENVLKQRGIIIHLDFDSTFWNSWIIAGIVNFNTFIHKLLW